MLKYLLEVSLLLLAFGLTYRLVFHSLRHFSWNRIVLVLGMPVCLAVPLLEIPLNMPAAAGYVAVGQWTDQAMDALGTGMPDALAMGTPTGVGTWYTVLLGVWIAGLALFGFRLLRNAWRLYRRFSRAPQTRFGDRTEISAGQGAHSFFRWIVIGADVPAGAARDAVLRHELAHKRLGHSLDLLLAELIAVLLWFHPVVYWLRAELKVVHEYQADAAAVAGSDAIAYSHLLLSMAQTRDNHAFLHAFARPSQTRRRIQMLHQKPQGNMSKLKYLVVLPLLGLMLFSFSIVPMPQDTPEHAAPIIDQPALGIENAPSGIPIAPGHAYKYTAGFANMKHPITGKMRQHTGIDLAAEPGTPIVAPADGEVIVSDREQNWGLRIHIRHDATYETRYAHMQKLDVEAGQTVTKGQVIGYVGNTGRSTGPHLHYEVHKEGKAVDPKDYLGADALH